MRTEENKTPDPNVVMVSRNKAKSAEKLRRETPMHKKAGSMRMQNHRKKRPFVVIRKSFKETAQPIFRDRNTRPSNDKYETTTEEVSIILSWRHPKMSEVFCRFEKKVAYVD